MARGRAGLFQECGRQERQGECLQPCGYFDTATSPRSTRWASCRITDRAKDVIKSGGEWISSIDIENIAVGAPGVACAAVIGVYHPKWDERPLLVVEPKPGAHPTKEEMLGSLQGKIAKWWTPDDVVFVEKIPLGATGKINKLALREMFKTTSCRARRRRNRRVRGLGPKGKGMEQLRDFWVRAAWPSLLRCHSTFSPPPWAHGLSCSTGASRRKP